MSDFIIIKPQKQLTHLIKPTGVIHIEHKVSLLGQKLFNILLAHAFPSLQTKTEHTITVKELLKYIPSAKNVSHLRKVLRELCIPVEFNIFDKDKEDWGFFALLPQAQIKKGTGICKYAFTSKMIELMADTSKMMYAKLTLLIQQKYRASKYGWFLYELCFDYKDVPGGGKTKKLPLEKLRQFLGVKEHQYVKYRSLNQHVLKKALADVNKQTELQVVSQEYKIGRKVTHIQYFVSLKKNLPPQIISKDGNTNYSSIFRHLGVSESVIKKSIRDYTAEQISKALLVYREEEETKGVQYPTAFLEDALKEGWNPKLTPEAPASKETKTNDLALENAEIKKEQKLYHDMTDNEKFNHMLKISEVLKKVYSKLSTENQEKVKQYAYKTVFPSFEGFKPCCSPVFEKVKELKNK